MEDTSSPENVKKAAFFFNACRLRLFVVSIVIQKKYVSASASNLSCSGGSHVGLLFTSEEQKRVGSRRT